MKVGLNMKFGGDPNARFDDYALRGSLREQPAIADAEIGARVWYSFGRFQKDLGAGIEQGRQNVLVSRLTYDTTAASGELFGRIDGPSDLFLKGFAGGGTLTKGKMNDEDWLINYQTVPYSNTLSDPVKGSIAYATIDAGYDLLRGRAGRFGGFVGYNYYRDNKSAYGCVQFANPNAGCIPSFPATVLGITENDTWHSLRVGINGTLALGYGLTLTADAAYLPYVKFLGTDNHLQRTDVANTASPERGTGQGVQLETILSYQFNNAFSIGAGARYWAMWATTNAYTNAFGTPCPCQTLPSRTERYGTFLQAAYKFDSL
ncbi:omptin family outer membrane protease [Rhodopseudomonas sp. B29]|uniref:omptin family outer membrane protease n=1 Tax=Rhodopseudomonas sp. B29 TaxID=95607 RepID=UPI00034D100B|nr:omptin family outer membrane protease [Rhodopseudomonas sp. B29]